MSLTSRSTFTLLLAHIWPITNLGVDADELVDDSQATLIGICLCFSNIGLSSFGWILQRKAGLVQGTRARCLLASLGTILYILSALPDVVAYTKIPEVLASIIACFRTVLVCLLGHFFLKERLGKRDRMAICVVMFGGIVCVYFGPKATQKADGMHLEIKSYPHKVLMYMIFAWLLTVISFFVVHLLLKARSDRFVQSLRYNIVFTTAIAYALEKVYNSELGKINMDKSQLLWFQTICCVVLLGVVDFYMNFLAAWNLPAHLFDPLKFSLCTLLQLFQGMSVLDEFVLVGKSQKTLTFVGISLALVGSLLIRRGKRSNEEDTIETQKPLLAA